MARQGTHDCITVLELTQLLQLDHARHGSRRGRLAEDSLFSGDCPVRMKDLLICHHVNLARGVLHGLESRFPTGGIPDPDCSRDGLRVLDDVAAHDWSRSRSLKAHHPRQTRDLAGRPVLGVPAPVRRDIPGIADRQHVHSGRGPQLIAHLHGSSLLSFNPVRIDRVDELDLVGRRNVLHDSQRLVEVPLDLNDSRPVHHRLRELPESNLPRRNKDVHRQSCLCTVGRGGG